MKRISVCCLALGLALSCSKQPAGQNVNSNPALASTGVSASQIELIETVEAKERREIKKQASELLAKENYDALEELARKFRASKECFGDGLWKLNDVYSGISLDEKKDDVTWEHRLTAIRMWVKSKPESITARVGLAEALVSYGWKARGSGYANTVSQSGWKLFHQRLTEAVEVLNDAKVLKETCPRWSAIMLKAGLGLGMDKGRYEAIFNEATRNYPEYNGFYFQKAYFLLPRWYGTPMDTANFLQQAADRIGGEEGDILYAQAAWFLQGIEANIFDDRGLSWERADRGFQILEKKFPDSLFVRNGRAYIAVIGCPKTLLPRRLVTGLGGKIDPEAWTSKENFNRLTRDLFRS